MSFALPQSAQAAGLNKDFYITIAGIIPVLFITIAVEGRLIQGFLDASGWVFGLAGWIGQPFIVLAGLWPSIRDTVAERATRDSRRGANQDDRQPRPAMSWIWKPFVLAVLLLLSVRPPRKHPQPEAGRNVPQPRKAAARSDIQLPPK